MVFRSIPIDVMYICAELVTGKSIPVLVGITRLPVDQFLAWLMLLLGAVFGTLFSVYTSRAVTGMTLLGFSNRLIQLCFSLCMSLSMLLSVSTGIQASSGFVLSLIPAFCVVAQNLPQRDSTALLSFGLCSLLFYVAMITSVMAEKREVDSMALTMMMHHDRGLVGPGRKSVARETEGVWRYVWRSLQLFLLGFYACIQHAPTQVYFATHYHHSKPASYASHHHAIHGHYNLFVGLLSAWIRVCVWSSVCFFQDNNLHAILENDRSRGAWDWVCCSGYMTCLLYSACWTATQIREQVLPRFNIESVSAKLKLLACVLALAALFRQRDPYAMFMAVNVLTLLSLLTTLFTLKPAQ